MHKKISSTVKGLLSRIVIAVLVLQNFAFAVPVTQAAQVGSGISRAGVAVSPMVAAADGRSFSIKSDGTVWAWGNGTHVPTQVADAGDPSGFFTGVKSLGNIGYGGQGIALKTDGTVWTFGFAPPAQVVDSGDPSGFVTHVTSFTSASGGSIGANFLKSDGTVWAWDYATDPTLITGLSGVTALATGQYHSLALESDGTVWAWGDGSHGELGNGTHDIGVTTPVEVIDAGDPSGYLTGIVAIAAGPDHSVALKSNGTVWNWGFDGVFGVLGDNGASGANSDVPVQVQDPGDGSGFLTGVSTIAAEWDYTLALKANGTVWGWGYDGSGQLGDGVAGFITFSEYSPLPVQASGLSNITAIAAGDFHALAMKSDGSVYGWGYNFGGEIGDGTTTPSNVPVNIGFNLYVNPAGVIAVSGGYSSHSLALKANGTVWAWGINSSGELGNGTFTDSNFPVQVSGLTSVVAVSGRYHSMALKSDGTVWTWGYNGTGALGNNTTANSNVPVQVHGPGNVGNLTDIVAIAAGHGHSLALKSDGTVWAWGDNGSGDLGDNTTTERDTPVQVHGVGNAGFLTDVVAISGSYGSMALRADGTVVSWGFGTYGQLGNGANGDSHYPVVVSGLSGVKDIAAGSLFGLALKADGTVRSWGYNFFGQLGNASSTNTNTPVTASGLSGVTNIAGGEHTSVAITSDGTAWGWGYGADGQLGDGTFNDYDVPTQVPGFANAKNIATDYVHTLAVKSDGTVWAWGDNLYGELGNCTNTNSGVPVQVNFGTCPAGPSLNTTNNVVVLSREAINATATATIYFTLSSAISTPLDLTFDSAFTGLDVSSASASTPSAPGCMTNFAAVNGHEFTADKAGCTGAVIISNVIVVNPPAAGPYLVSWVNDAPGSAMVAIVDSDQVTVNATVDPTITFDLDAGLAAGETAAPYTVALGALTIGAVNHSDHSGVNSIFAQLDTNATSGAQVTVLSANAALKSASAPADTIPNSAASMAAGAANYGICVNSVTPPTQSTGTFEASAPYNAGTCDPAGGTNAVKALNTVTPTNILDSASAPLSSGTSEILVNAAISTSTPAHSDYTDTLTFVATGTF